MKSVGAMIQQLDGLLGTDDATPWECEFIRSVSEKSNGGKATIDLTSKQVEKIESIWSKHFA